MAQPLIIALAARAISALGHLRPTNSTPVPAIVRYAPLATEMARHRERSEVPKSDMARYPRHVRFTPDNRSRRMGWDVRTMASSVASRAGLSDIKALYVAAMQICSRLPCTLRTKQKEIDMPDIERTSAGLQGVIPGCERCILPKSATSSDDTGQGRLDFNRLPTLREKLTAVAQLLHKDSDEISATADRPMSALVELFSMLPKSYPNHRRYIIEIENGALVFRREELCLIFEDVMNEKFGPKPEHNGDDIVPQKLAKQFPGSFRVLPGYLVSSP
jgi:hypothetical protein